MSGNGQSQQDEQIAGVINDGSAFGNRLATGSDNSAGIATRTAARVLLAFAFPWVITRRVVSKGAPRLAGLLRNAGTAVSKVAGIGARAVATRLAFVALGITAVARPVVDLCGHCRRAVGRGFRLVGNWASRAERRVGAIIKVAVEPVKILISRGRTTLAALVRMIHGAGRLIAWLLRPFLSAGLAVLHRVAAIMGTGLRAVYGVVGACHRLLKNALVSFGRLLRRCLPGAARAALVPLRFVAACSEFVWRCLAGALRPIWAAAAWAWRRLLAPCISAIGSVLAWAFAVFIARPSTAVARLVRASARILMSGLRRLCAPVVHVIGRLASLAATAVGHSFIAISKPIDRAIRYVAGHLSDPIRAAAAAIGAAVGARRRAVAQGALVAFGTARHQARTAGLALSSQDLGWRAAIPQSRASDEADDQSIAAIFTTECFHNAFVAPGVSRVSAIVSVSAEETGLAPTAPELVELILVDCSASMGHPWEKIQAARSATRAAVEALRDGVWFAIVRGAESAEVVYPRQEGLVQASPETKAAAAKAVGTLQPVGGTAIGRWLTLAADLMALRPHALHHAILLTDGKDEDETAAELDAAVARCEGLFQCDCRGIGTDWAVSELRKISAALLGSLDIISDPAAMEDDFRLITAAAMARQLEASLRVWIPNHARINFLRQVSPTILDLTSRGRAAEPLSTEYQTGAWGNERREYHLSVDVHPGLVGAEMLASRVSVVVRNKIVAKALVKVSWTADETLTAPLSAEVTHYAGQAELATAIQDGLQAHRDKDDELATAKFGRAVQLAAESGNDAITGLLGNIVDVIDVGTGTVRLRKTIELSDEMTLDTRSTKTVRISQLSTSPESARTSDA